MDTTADSRKFVKKCGALLGSNGWATSAVHDESLDWKIDNWHLHFLITCGASNMLDFVSMTRIIELMEQQVRRCRVRQTATTLFVLEFELGGASLVKLADWGIAAFYVHELDLVTSLARLQNEIPANLDNRQLLLLKHSPWACLSISERFRKSGDISSAFEWARRAVPDDGQPNPRINRIVFDIFFNAQSYEEAERFALDRLEANRGDPEMLRALQKLAQHRGNLTEIELINARVTNLPANAPGTNFDAIIERQKQRRLLADQKPASGGSVNSSETRESKKSGGERLSPFRKGLGKLFRD